MGRHSAPDDADDEVGAQPQTLALAPDADLAAVIESRGRHVRADAAVDEPVPQAAQAPDIDETQRIAIIADEQPEADHPFPLDLHTITEPGPAGPDEDPAAEPVDKRTAKAERKAARRAERDAARSAEDERGPRESDTRADLRLLRHNAAVRAQAIGAVIASFLIYTLVMIVVGRTGDYVVWLWVPIVVAGVLVGLVLDLAHRRIAKQDRPAGADGADGGQAAR